MTARAKARRRKRAARHDGKTMAAPPRTCRLRGRPTRELARDATCKDRAICEARQPPLFHLP